MDPMIVVRIECQLTKQMLSSFRMADGHASQSLQAAFARLTASERMGDGRRHRVRRSSVRDLGARQRGIRIDFEGDGDQRERQDDGHGSHGSVCRTRLRQTRSNNPAKNRSYISEMGQKLIQQQPARVSREADHRQLRVVLAMNRCLHRQSPLPAVAAFAAYSVGAS